MTMIVVFLLLTLNIFHIFSSASIVDFEQLNVNWVPSNIMDSLKIKKEKMHPEVLVVSWIVKRSFSFLEESNLLCVHFT